MQDPVKFYVIVDLKTNEYLDLDCEWSQLHPTDGNPRGPSPYLYPTEADAESGIADIFGAWDTNRSTPDRSEYEIRSVMASDWIFV